MMTTKHAVKDIWGFLELMEVFEDVLLIIIEYFGSAKKILKISYLLNSYTCKNVQNWVTIQFYIFNYHLRRLNFLTITSP